MKPKSQKNQKLLSQYPFVGDILSSQMMEPWDDESGTQVNDLTIRVQKADGDLMYRQANNYGLGDSSFIFSSVGDRENQIMRCGEYLFAIDHEGEIINRLNWPRNIKERANTEEVFGFSIFWLYEASSKRRVGSIFNETKYLVWVTVRAWYVDTHNDELPEGRFGEFCDRSVSVTIYGEPKDGFRKLQESSNVYTNLHLSGELMARGFMSNNHDIISIGGMLYELCLTFQDEVYFSGMKEVLDDGGCRGASGQFGSVEVLCAEMCGYHRVTLKDSKSYVTFQLRPNSNDMYVLGQQGTLPQVRNLVRTVVRMWRENPELLTLFRPDKEVSFI